MKSVKKRVADDDHEELVLKTINAEHKDIIHDIAYDYYGLRMATCSSDQTVKVWDLDEENEWYCTDEWKKHCSSVWRVQWAHPEFGQVLATCSFDRSSAIWEEIDSGVKGKRMWVRRATQTEANAAIMDIKFAPKHLGLQLASCSQDGYVRVYEAPDTTRLSNWQMSCELSTQLTDLSSIAWSQSRFYEPLLVVGSQLVSGGSTKILVYRFSEVERKWLRVEQLFTSVIEPVHDVSFAPSVGRSFHLIAIASKDILIAKLSHDSAGNYTTQTLSAIDENERQVWRISWNITGTVLSSSGDDGRVRLYQGNGSEWRCVGNIKADTAKYTCRSRPTVSPRQQTSPRQQPSL